MLSSARIRFVLLLIAGSATGAVAQQDLDRDEVRQHWAFRAIDRHTLPPVVRHASWPRDPIDQFVLARLEAERLAPAPDADARTWIRRVTLDLTGLPPAIEDAEAFAADPSAAARAAVVDRLLASPAYGEHQARAWLDLARYSDSNGLDENLAFANAWRYRDWVIRAFNADVPYDEFITMQLAGDLMPPTEDEQEHVDRLCATGFLSLGPKMLAEQDKEKLVMDIVDEQIDVTTKAVLGLTVACARCHDHKFDPIPTTDYYALAGIWKSTSTMENLEHVSRWREVELATPEDKAARDAWFAESKALDADLEAATAAADAALEATMRNDLAAYLLAGDRAARQVVWAEAESFARGNLRVDSEQWGSPATVVVHTGRGGPQWAEWDVEIADAGRYELQVRFAAKESRPVRLSLGGRVIAEKALVETTGDWFPKDQQWSVVGRFELRAGAHVLRLDREAAIPHIDEWLLVPIGGGEEVATWPNAVAQESGLVPELVRAAAEFLADPARHEDPVFGVWHAHASRTAPVAAQPSSLALDIGSGLRVESLRDLAVRYQAAFEVVDRAWRTLNEAAVAIDAEAAAADPPQLPDADQEQLRLAVLGPEGLFGSRGEVAADHLPQPHRDRLAALRTQREALDARRPPDHPFALGVIDGQPVDVPVHIRGDHLSLAETATPRGALTLFEPLVPPLDIPAGRSGRLALARWLFHPRHPLTARVAANRIWQSHFGHGLSRTPSNFGPRGEAPSHPELLDYLATALIESGWSMKALHRRIVLSRTYALSSRVPPEARAADPENRLLAAWPRRRLAAEALRDSILAVGGSLDRTMGGTLLGTKNRDYVTNDQSNDAAHYDTTRRSIYLPLIRNAVYDQFTLFDFNDPSVPVARRAETAVPIQALWLMNSKLVRAQSLALARRVASEVDEERARVDRAFRHAYARPATEAEIDRALAYVHSTCDELRAATTGAAHEDGDGAASPAERAWALFCQVLFASNEFLHID